MDRGRVTQPPVEYLVKKRVEYQILADFLSTKVEFLLVYMGHSQIIIWLLPINGGKHKYLGLIQLDSTSIQLDATSIHHNPLEYRYSTQG